MSRERELLERVVNIANGNIIDEIKEYLAQTEQKPAPWEPKHGAWCVGSNGDVYRTIILHCTKLFGVVRQTKEQAEQAAVAMRRFNRLLAYRDEFAAGYIFQRGGMNCYVYANDRDWFVESTSVNLAPAEVYFPMDVALELCRKLNSGAVIL